MGLGRAWEVETAKLFNKVGYFICSRSCVVYAVEFVKLNNVAGKKIHIFMSVSSGFVSDAGDGAGDVFDVVH